MLYDAMGESLSVNIRAMSRNRAEQVGDYRFLENPNVSVSEQVRSTADHCQHQGAGRYVLAISDRSDVNLQAQAEHLKAEAIGVVGNHHDIGFFLHILAFMVTLRLLPLHIGRADESLSASVAFSEPQQQCLEPLMPTVQGRTRKQQNPFSPGSLPWATRLMARLGG